MLTTRGTEALIALEDAQPDVLFEKLPGTRIPIWPHLRIRFAQATAQVELKSSVVPRTQTRAQVYMRLVRAFLPDLPAARSVMGQSDYCYVVSGATVRDTPQGVENWLVDSFARAFEANSVVIQDRPLRSSRQTANRFEKTYSFDSSRARIDVATKLSSLSSEVGVAVRRVIREAAKQIDFELDGGVLAAIERSSLYQIARVKHLDHQYEKLLDRLQPKVVLMDNASYGGRASVISMMKDRGTLVIEPQHGWIGPSHGAYNFGAAMSDPANRATLPDALLTFGDFWSSEVRVPYDVVSIGKPHVEEMSRNRPALGDRALQVLVVSSVAEPTEMADFTLKLREALPTEWEVVFRPHPSERTSMASRYPALVNAPGVTIDENSDVYTSLRAARGVVGVASTVLYEALGMGCHVFVRDSPLSKYYVADFFGELIENTDGISEMVARLRDAGTPQLDRNLLESIWKPNAVDNFRRYIELPLGAGN